MRWKALELKRSSPESFGQSGLRRWPPHLNKVTYKTPKSICTTPLVSRKGFNVPTIHRISEVALVGTLSEGKYMKKKELWFSFETDLLFAVMVARNGSLTKFYIEMVIQLFCRWKKKHFENEKMFFRKIFENLKIVENQIFPLKNIWFRKFWEKKKLKIFFVFKMHFFVEKKELWKKLDYNFDVEFCQESISGKHKCKQQVSLEGNP